MSILGRRIRILVSGGGGDVADSIVSCLETSSLKVEVVVASSSVRALELYNVQNLAQLPEVSSEGYIESLTRALKFYQIDLFIPGVDGELELVARHASEMQSASGAKIFIGDYSIVSQFCDKFRTVKFLEKNFFQYPVTVPTEDLLEASKFVETASFPIIIKPRNGRGSIDVKTLETRESAREFCGRPHMVLQEKLPTKDGEFTAGVYVGRDGDVKGSCVLRRSLVNGSTQFAENIMDSRIVTQVEEIAVKCRLNYVNIQFALRDRMVVPFEINPRFSGSTFMQHLVFNGPEMAVLDFLLGSPISKKQNFYNFRTIRKKSVVFISSKKLDSRIESW